VQLHTVVVAQRAHEAAHRRCEAALMKADEGDDVAEWRVGLPVPRRRLDPRRETPILIRCKLAAVTNLLRASLVAVECGHGSGSMMVMGCGGAMRIGEAAWSAKRVLCDGEGAGAALGRKRKGRGRRTLSVEVKIRLVPPPLDL
jgi:hypothetical protein